MNFEWSFFLDLGFISIALLIATFLRAKIKFFQKFLIPNALTAGFLLLPFYNYIIPQFGLSGISLEGLIYHLLSISFISMSLRKRNRKPFGKSVLSTSVMIVSSLTLQGIIGFGLTFLAIATVFPNLFPSFGLFIPLGFELGPGQALSIGLGWQELGFEGAGSIGLTFAAFGFLWACFGGVILMNLGIRHGWVNERQAEILRKGKTRTGVVAPKQTLEAGALLTTESEAIDSMSLNVAVVACVYLFTYLFLQGITALLSLVGPLGEELAINLWGLSFVFAAIFALITRKIIDVTGVGRILDDGSLTRISGLSVDLLVAASVGAISLVVVLKNWIPLLVMGAIAGVVTALYTFWVASRIFKDHQFERAVMLFGASTGTLPTGLALLRVVDPRFETPVATDYMYGSGIAFFLVIPYILSINLPAHGFAQNDPSRYLLMAGLLGLYLLLVLVSLRLLGGKGTFRRFRRLWDTRPYRS
ncbi:MAG: sodium:glutamate symporter [Spirochaetales bacterium]|jgi:glutamate:Na+ symporter, ESS family|nr:sodium:glutamate symporter [Spirochaetales bacterium]